MLSKAFSKALQTTVPFTFSKALRLVFLTPQKSKSVYLREQDLGLPVLA